MPTGVDEIGWSCHSGPMRNLVVVLGDQLNADAAVFDGFDPRQDAVWMAEVSNESEHVWSHKARIAVFLAAMRHFRDELRERGIAVHYVEWLSHKQAELAKPAEQIRIAKSEARNKSEWATSKPSKTINEQTTGETVPPRRDGASLTLGEALAESVKRLRPEKVLVVEPGEWRVREELKKAVPKLAILPDRHFMCSVEAFAAHAQGRKQLRLEFFYREMRRKHDVLMDGDQPVGGAWNFDAENRGSFGKSGPGQVPMPRSFQPDKVTREVLALVAERFAEHPGRLDRFDWPVTRKDALVALEDFVMNRLAEFGRYQDAMWTGEPWLYHSRISAAINLKLLDPREVIAAAVAAYKKKRAPLEAVEGFVRQILGWREYVRGIYWLYMPDYIRRNALEATLPLPAFYWTGDTEMNCLREAIGQTLDYGYAHHIQRLMVTGLYALLLGVDPAEVHKWYLAVYVDAVEWVELPNVLGMSQYADGGVMASKPYVATGKYIQRMSNYCDGCRFKPDKATGADACPFTTLYWDFLARHEKLLRQNQRMQMQLKNLSRKSAAELRAIRAAAAKLRA
jgi:deoxyribodipyrimidine photolyase-related protein